MRHPPYEYAPKTKKRSIARVQLSPEGHKIKRAKRIKSDHISLEIKFISTDTSSREEQKSQ